MTKELARNLRGRCKHCLRYYDRERVIGWSYDYCQPLCEKQHLEQMAKEFSTWWNRQR